MTELHTRSGGEQVEHGTPSMPITFLDEPVVTPNTAMRWTAGPLFCIALLFAFLILGALHLLGAI